MKKKVYEIKANGQDAQILRDTAKNAQAIVRKWHDLGIHATLRCIKNAAERRELLAVAN
jgi:hypothetical protein